MLDGQHLLFLFGLSSLFGTGRSPLGADRQDAAASDSILKQGHHPSYAQFLSASWIFSVRGAIVPDMRGWVRPLKA